MTCGHLELPRGHKSVAKIVRTRFETKCSAFKFFRLANSFLPCWLNLPLTLLIAEPPSFHSPETEVGNTESSLASPQSAPSSWKGVKRRRRRKSSTSFAEWNCVELSSFFCYESSRSLSRSLDSSTIRNIFFFVFFAALLSRGHSVHAHLSSFAEGGGR